MARGAVMDVQWDTSAWEQSFRETMALLGDMTPIMDAIGDHMEASIKTTLTEGGPPGGKFKPVLRGGTPLVDTGTHLRDRIHKSFVSSNEAHVSAGFEFAHVHQFGATITAKRSPYLVFQVGGQWVKKASVEIPARPFMTFRPEDPEKIAGLAEAAIEGAFGQGAGAIWSQVF